MANLVEEELMAGMRERVAGVAFDADLVGRVVHRERRRTVMTRSAYAVGVAGLAGAMAAGVLVSGAATPGTNVERPPGTSVQSPQLRLAAAVAASRGVSYRVKSRMDVHEGHKTVSLEGAFDPATVTGYLRMPAADGKHWYEERLIAGDLYTGDGGFERDVLWRHESGRHDGLTFDPKIGVPGFSADPQGLLDALDQAGATVSESGPDTFRFTVTLPARTGLLAGTMAGEVTVGAGRITKVAYTATIRSATHPHDVSTVDVSLELSDYGSPVTVERPPGTFEDLPGK